jgi:tetratricopeptide (TPR) repeat protein
VSQVRKDILNGWKEIGGYVCRDIRTVERWEKQRGLPVRRVPGAGRATVYALVSELDEWLETSKPEPAELPADSRILDAVSNAGLEPDSRLGSPIPSQQGQVSEVGTSGSGVECESNLSAITGKSESEDAGPAPEVPEARPASGGKNLGWLTLGRWRKGDGAIIMAAAVLLCLLVVPVGHSHAKSAVDSQRLSSNSGQVNSAIPYRSQVAGVDDLYLRGIYSYEQRTPESLVRSQEDFSSAIAMDPNYAPAYAALANTYNLLREYSVMSEQEAYPKARTAAEHAIALDPRLPEAHASLGFIDFFWSWDTVNAEREFRTAIALDPSSSLAHHWYGSMLTHEGRFSEAMEQLNLAQRLEPTSAAILSTRALALGLSGHRLDAVETLQDLISESPGVTSPHAILGTLSREEPQDTARFLFEMRRVAELRHSDEMLQVVAAAEPAFHSGGESAMWSAILTTEEQLHPGASNRTYLMAEAEVALGRYDAAFADLTQLTRRRDPNLIGVLIDPTLLPLRRDRRFGLLVASIGLPALPH